MDAFVPQIQHFRFYEDDGTEATASAIAGGEDPINLDRDNNADSQLHLRYSVEETGAGSVGGGGGDTWQLQFRPNGAGGWVNVTAASSRVQSDVASQLTDDGATTNRAVDGLTDPGSGSFEAGVQEEGDGVLTHQLGADNFTEHVYALDLIAADNAAAEFIEFRISYNGGAPGVTNNVTPKITITKPAAPGGRRIFVVS